MNKLDMIIYRHEFFNNFEIDGILLVNYSLKSKT